MRIVIIVFSIFILTMKAIHAKLNKQKPEDEDDEEMTTENAQTPPTYSTPREALEGYYQDRIKTGVCCFCQAKAIKQMPALELISSYLDGLYRYLNVVPLARWKIVIERDVSVPNALCEKHHEMARGHLESKIAENQTNYATFIEKVRIEMYEFERFGILEKMKDEVETIKRGKSKKIPNNNIIPLKNNKAANS